MCIFVRYILIIKGLFAVVLLYYSGISNAQGIYIREYQRLYERAQNYYDQGDYINAYASINKSIEKYRGYADAYLLRARIYETREEYHKALYDYSIYLEQEPQDREVLFLKAVQLYKLNRYVEAIQDFRKMQTLPAGETNVILFRQTRYEVGIDRIMSTQNKKDDYIYHYLALCYMSIQHFGHAIAYLDTAISISPYEDDYYYHRGLSNERLGFEGKAKSDYANCLSLNSDHAGAHTQLNLLEAKTDNTLSYIERLNQSIELHPGYPFTYQQRANYYIEIKAYKAALQDLNAAIAISDDNSDDFMNRGLVNEKLGNFLEAEKDYLKSIELNNQNERAYLNLGNFYVRQRQYEASLSYYNLALFYDVNYTLALYNRAIAYYYLKDNVKACADMLKAKQLGYEPAEKEFNRMCN